MTADVRRITEARKAQREATTLEARTPLALEQIADTLEAIRIDMIGLQQVLGAAASRQSGIQK